MATIIHRSDTRGAADHGWLKARHSFSFAGYNDPSRMHFGVLRVLNDDLIAGGMGFGKHPHDNMEIVTIPLEGAIEHKDSTGRHEVIRSGDVQIMSAGSGIAHSEFNASKTDLLNLLQIWVFPKKHDIEPRYEQKTFEASQRKNRWQIVVSPDLTEGGVWINQDAKFVLGDFDAGQKTTYTPSFKGNGVYAFLIEGTLEINGVTLNRRDAAGFGANEVLNIQANADAKVLLIDLPLTLPEL